MTLNERMLKIVELIDGKIYQAITPGGQLDLPDFPITEKDIEEIGLSFHQLVSGLHKLEHAGLIEVKDIDNSSETREERFIREHSGEPAYPLMTIFVHQSLFGILTQLENGVEWKDVLMGGSKFDENKSILHVQGHSIKVARQQDRPVEHYILDYIFKNGEKKEHDYIDLQNDGVYDTKIEITTYINACKSLNNKVEKDSDGSIKNFLIYGTSELGSVRINPTYLK